MDHINAQTNGRHTSPNSVYITTYHLVSTAARAAIVSLSGETVQQVFQTHTMSTESNHNVDKQ